MFTWLNGTALKKNAVWKKPKQQQSISNHLPPSSLVQKMWKKKKRKKTSCESSVRWLYLKDSRNWISKKVLTAVRTVNCKALPTYPGFSEENRMNCFPVSSSQNTKNPLSQGEKIDNSYRSSQLYACPQQYRRIVHCTLFSWEVLSQERSCESNFPAVFSTPKLG